MELREQLARTGADLIGMVTKSITYNACTTPRNSD